MRRLAIPSVFHLRGAGRSECNRGYFLYVGGCWCYSFSCKLFYPKNKFACFAAFLDFLDFSWTEAATNKTQTVNQKSTIEIWLARDGQDPVLKTICTDRGKYDFSSVSGARESMRAYCICMLLAKEKWSPGFPKEKLDDAKIIEARRSRKKRKTLTFVNTVASLYISRGRDKGRAQWFAKYLKAVSDPIKGKYRDKKRDFVRIVFRQVWADYEWEFFTVGQDLDDPIPLRNPVAFARELQSGFSKWKKLPEKEFSVEKLRVPGQKENPGESTQQDISTSDSLNRLKASFDRYLAKAKHLLEDKNWFKAINDPTHPEHQLAQITTRIGDRQREKIADPGARRSLPVNGDWHFLLESTHKVFLSANRAFPEIGRAFESLVDAIEVIDQAATCCEKLQCHFSRNAWVRDVGEVISPRQIYVLLLFFTYLCIECPTSQRVSRSKILFEKNTLFCLLDGYRPGINDCFFQYHGKKVFCREGEIFRNRYYQERVVHEGDTLQTIIHDSYLDGDVDFAACRNGLVQAHEFLKNVPVDAPLLPIVQAAGRTSITIVPPATQNNNYQRQVDEMKKWREDRNRDEGGDA